MELCLTSLQHLPDCCLGILNSSLYSYSLPDEVINFNVSGLQ